MADPKSESKIKVKTEDIADTALENVVLPVIPAEKPIVITNEKVILYNISNSLREIDLGKGNEIRIEPKEKKEVPASVLEHEAYKSFQSSFLIIKSKKEAK